MQRKILMLDSDGDLAALGTALASIGDDCTVEAAPSLRALQKRLGTGLCDLLVVDTDRGDGEISGVEVIRRLRKRDDRTPVVATAERGDVDSVAAAIKAGATDFLVRGPQLDARVDTLLEKVRNLLALIERNRVLGEQNLLLREADRARFEIIGESPQVRDVLRRIERVAAIPRPVLIVGERGTGKELVARAIHRAAVAEAADPAARPFVAVNCAAFTDTLLESELFGHERGAFTGAEGRREGRFEQARGGTLFLDEIGNMSLPFQQKILRVVEYGTFTRVGGSAEVETDARIIAATNADLQAKMGTGVFLRDLYDRLTFETIRVPPLREREGDVELLARHFLHAFMQEIPALGGKRLAQSAIDALKAYGFPGNVRELKNIIERAAYRDVTNEITPVDIGMLPTDAEASTLNAPGETFEEKVEAFQERLIREAYAAADENGAEAARRLGLSYHQFRYYLKKFRDGG